MESKSRPWLWIILGIVVVGGLTVVLVCAGLWWHGWNVLADQSRAAMNRNVVILEHLGEVLDIEVELVATADQPNEDVFVFKAVGAKGTGVVTAEFLTVDADNEAIVSGTLELPDGRTFDLVPGSAEDGGP